MIPTVGDLVAFLLAEIDAEATPDAEARRLVVIGCRDAVVADQPGSNAYARILLQLASRYEGRPGFRPEWSMPRGQDGPTASYGED